MTTLRQIPSPGRYAMLVAALIVLSGHTRAADRSFVELSIEELMNEPVNLVSRKPTRLLEAPAALSVVTSDDMRRLGASNIPEALRYVPGMFVGQIDDHTYTVSARGFAGGFSDKMLIMIDGRTVYEPTFAGPNWASQDVMFEDLDRIEVIRGPGATLWGANAVNGVVNIVTKSSRETQGPLVAASSGTHERASVSARYGGQFQDDIFYRAYVKHFDREALVTSAGEDIPDEWDGFRAGFRADWQPAGRDEASLQGDFYSNNVTAHIRLPQLTPPYVSVFDKPEQHAGGNVLARWARSYSESSDISIQSYYTRSEYNVTGSSTKADTWDLELQRRFELGRRNDIVWGAGYRLIKDKQVASGRSRLTPPSRTMHLYTAFLQDEIVVLPDRLSLTLGSKLEHNDQTGFEVQPGARLLWKLADNQAAWTSVARAVRTPDRFERDGRANLAVFPTGPTGPPALRVRLGNPDVEVEELTAYELGYRTELSNRVSFDAAVFYNVYDNIIQFKPAEPRLELTPSPPHLLIPIVATNNPGGVSRGAELSVQWDVSNNWRLSLGYSWLHMPFMKGDSEFAQPAQQASVRSFLTLPRNLELSGAASYVDRLDNFNVPSYVRLDLGLVTHVTQSLELGVWGQNLLESHHPEFLGLGAMSFIEVPRSFMAKVSWSPK